jgi:hypothetical protein
MRGQRKDDTTTIAATALKVSEPVPFLNTPVEPTLAEAEISALAGFFTLLDSWERQSHATEKL